jgi:hypothetical protein
MNAQLTSLISSRDLPFARPIDVSSIRPLPRIAADVPANWEGNHPAYAGLDAAGDCL